MTRISIMSLSSALLLATTKISAYTHITRRDLLDGSVETVSSEEQPYIIAPKHLAPGDLATIVRRDDGSRVDPESFLIGLPPKVTEMFNEYVQTSGLMEIFSDLLYKDPVKKGENKVYDLKDGSKWSARTSNNWVRDGDMTWIDPANEWTYEFILDVWRKAGFDKILNTLGEKFGNDGLWLDGTSFIIVSQFNGNNLHTDLEGAYSKVFNIIFPLIIPDSTSQLLVAEPDHEGEGVPINFRHDVGVLVGGDSFHGTGNCNYRDKKQFRLAIAVYFIDTNEENVEEFASDDTAFYPPMGSEGFLMAQAGRHWGGNNSLVTDKGRGRLDVYDERGDCEAVVARGICDSNLELRNQCLKSCKVFMVDSEYYEHLGKILHWPTESEQT